jgi:hypothetical protein
MTLPGVGLFVWGLVGSSVGGFDDPVVGLGVGL